MDFVSVNEFEGQKGIGILRADLDVNVKDGQVFGGERLDAAIATLSLLLQKGAEKILVIGHIDRPKGKYQESLSTKPFVDYLGKNLKAEVNFARHYPKDKLYVVREAIEVSSAPVVVLDNIRFWAEEEENDNEFAKELASMALYYVNEAFGASHREHSSVVGIPKHVKENGGSLYAGLRFAEEIENLKKVREDADKPLVAILGGAKKDKTEFIEKFKEFSDLVMVVGRLPDFLPDDENRDPKLFISKLNPDKEDITIHSIEKIEQEVARAETIVVAGPVGLYEDGGHSLGTQRVLTAIANSKAKFKLAGGGDTAKAIDFFNRRDAFDWISVGGGASLDYLANGTLPGIEALKHS